MFRIVLSTLLIANLLVCPLRCVSCQAGAASVEDCAPAGCSCCHCDTLPPVAELPENCPPVDFPSDDCPCPNCICEGATLQNDLELPAANTQAASFGHRLVTIERGINVDMMQESAGAAQDWDRRNSGRGARIAHHCWLL